MAYTTAPATGTQIDNTWVRSQFPSLFLTQDGAPVVFFDNPAGTQVPRRTADAITEYLMTANANVHGGFLTSDRTDAVVAKGREGMAALLGASPREIAFGPNMTTLTYAVSRALARDFSPGDEIVLTELDHDANITPWVEVARERGLTIKRIPVRLDDCTLDLDALQSLLTPRTRIVAVTYASNAVGTITDVERVSRMAHEVGAHVWVDAVHYGPHGPIDVRASGIDYLVCSAYKFFGPHLGIIYGRYELLERMRSYTLRPAPQAAPDKLESGTKNHECIAGLNATLDYLAELGRRTGSAEIGGGLRAELLAGLTAIHAYEQTLSAALLEGFATVPGLRIYGITDGTRIAERVPTFALTVRDIPSPEVARLLGEQGIFTWSGNYYALEIMQRLGLEDKGGAVRVGAVHYNTFDEVDRLVEALKKIAG